MGNNKVIHKFKVPLEGIDENRIVDLNKASKFIKENILNCGADRDRTCDLLNANQALSQLSYSP